MESLIRRLLPGLMLLGMLGGAKAQNGIHPGMVSTQATFSLGVFNARQEYRYFLYTNAEVILDEHLGIDGGLYVQLGSSKGELHDPAPSRHTDMRVHSLLFGPNHHFILGKPLDIYAGAHPGLHLVMEPAPFGTGPAYDHVSVAPAASAVVGVAYYGSFFHLFGQARGIYGNSVGGTSAYKISELRLSFGLGFNFN